MREEWKDIKGYEGLYQVSNLCRVKGLDRIIISKNGISVFHKGAIKKQSLSHGYLTTTLHKDTKNKRHYVHRLVAQAFIPNPENKPQINHKNGIRSDNDLSNIEWTTQSENMIHAYKTGLSSNQIKIKLIDDYKNEYCFKSLTDADKWLDKKIGYAHSMNKKYYKLLRNKKNEVFTYLINYEELV